MRVRLKYSGSDCGSSCGTTSYGEVEDYSLNVEGTNKWLTITPASGTISQSNNQSPLVTFDATGLAEGIYTGTVTLNSNDADEGTIVIPCTMNVSNGFTVSLNAFLEGPFDGSGMMAMQNGYIPLVQPFNMAPWYYSGTESLASVPSNMVDWVLVDLRDAASASGASSATRIARQAAVLLDDGSIVETDGSSPLFFSASVSNNLFVVLFHKNHIGVISAYPLTNTGGSYEYDFTTGSDKVLGGVMGYKQLAPGVWGLVSGDGNCDGQISSLDKTTVWSMLSGKSGYIMGDYNLDGQVDNKDKNDGWKPNMGMGCQVPE